MTGDDPEVEVDGLVVRLDVRVPDAGRAAEVAETLARMAAGFAADGTVASLIVHPDAFTIDHALDTRLDPPEDDDDDH